MVLPLFILEDEHSFKHGGMAGKVFYVIKSSKEQKERNKKERKRKEKKNERKKEKNKMLLTSFWLH